MAKPEPTMSDVLTQATEQIAMDGAEAAIETVEQAPTPAPFVYDTESTEMARMLINQIDRLGRLLSEDDAELDHIGSEYLRQHDDIVRRHDEELKALFDARQEAERIVRARRADREHAQSAARHTVQGLQK